MSRHFSNQTNVSDFSASDFVKDAAAVKELFLAQGLREVDINVPSEGAKGALKRWLSVKSVISTASSDATKQLDAANDASLQIFRSVGKGFCAELFDQVGLGKVLKRAHTPQNNQLWNDFSMHSKIRLPLQYALFLRPDIKLSIPTPFEYYTRDDVQWWAQNRHKWPGQVLKEPTDLIEMERILPLPKIVRESLIDQYCTADQKDSARKDPKNRDCLIRVYLGQRRRYVSASNEKFCLRNFEADLTIVDDLGLEKTLYAKAMAIALATMHWDSKVDGADVEFVLGTAPDNVELSPNEILGFTVRINSSTIRNFKRKAVYLWLLDFNQVSTISMDDAGVTKAMTAYWQNDPYFPRPQPPYHEDRPLWDLFTIEYLVRSAQIYNPIQQRLGLAKKFINGLVMEARNQANILSGPPRGEGPPSRGVPRGVRGTTGRGGKGRGIMTGTPELDT